MDVIDAACRFARQTRGIEILDITIACVQKVEDIECHAEMLADVPAQVGIEQGGRLRSHQVVLRQAFGSEVAQPQAGKEAVRPSVQVVYGNAAIKG